MTPFEWLFRNRRTGEITIGQPPNLLSGLMIASALAAWLFPGDRFGRASRVVSSAAWTLWGLDELTRGVNPFRRLTGLGALAAQVARGIRS